MRKKKIAFFFCFSYDISSINNIVCICYRTIFYIKYMFLYIYIYKLSKVKKQKKKEKYINFNNNNN